MLVMTFYYMSVPQIEAVVAKMNCKVKITMMDRFVLCSRSLIL